MKGVIQECKEALVELRFASRFAEIEMWHKVGEIITNSTAKPSDIPRIAEELDENVQDLWNAILFYKRYPKLEDFVSGKDISWTKICPNVIKRG